MSQLIAIGLIEKDTEDVVEFTWAYPTMDTPIKELLIRKCPPNNLPESNQYLIPYVFGHGEGFWYYLLAAKFDNKQYSRYVTDFVSLCCQKISIQRSTTIFYKLSCRP